jgi:hypothetical protein
VKILLPENAPFDLNQPTSKLIDSKMCVFEYSDKDYMDFYFKKITTFISYRYPTVELLIGGKYRLALPLNWRVLVTNTHDYMCRLVPIEDLFHFENQVPVFNPYHIGLPKIMDVEIVNLNPSPIEHFVPKLPKKNLLVMPVGHQGQWETRTINKDGSWNYYPECIYACDDIDMSKCELNLHTDLIGE